MRDFGGGFDAAGSDDGDSGDDLVGGSSEQAEHARGVVGVEGLAKDFSVWGDDGGVGSKNKEWIGILVVRGVLRLNSRIKDGLGFFAGEADDVGNGRFAGPGLFGDVGGRDGEGEAGLDEEFLASRRCGSEYEHRLIIAESRAQISELRAQSSVRS